ncbi:aspartate/glutamate racemase family protein [Desulfobacula sp.]|uniref:maleate cis-trans isomerase family protein n=1 Tax=Desulfobacula sp. TaxID=2593537 RepID=UPI00262248B3|nr:aspartate/glutamate racemase family protein [Desulfobacula sp.]
MKLDKEKFQQFKMMTAPPGWRSRIGIIIPSSEQGIAVREHEMIFPEGVVPIVTRMMLTQTTAEALIKMGKDAEYAAELIATSHPSCVSYSCTSGAFLKGAEFDENLIRKIEKITGTPATTMAKAALEALKQVDAKRILLVCPYNREIVKSELSYFKDSGITVVHHKGLGLSDTNKIYRITPWETYQLVMEAFKETPEGEADAIFISCGGLRALEIIEYVEKETGIPCITSNQANAWHCLKLSGIQDSISGFGALLEKNQEGIKKTKM